MGAQHRSLHLQYQELVSAPLPHPAVALVTPHRPAPGPAASAATPARNPEKPHSTASLKAVPGSRHEDPEEQALFTHGHLGPAAWWNAENAMVTFCRQAEVVPRPLERLSGRL